MSLIQWSAILMANIICSCHNVISTISVRMVRRGLITRISPKLGSKNTSQIISYQAGNMLIQTSNQPFQRPLLMEPRLLNVMRLRSFYKLEKHIICIPIRLKWRVMENLMLIKNEICM